LASALFNFLGCAAKGLIALTATIADAKQCMAVAISRSGLLNSGRDFVFVFHICPYLNPHETKKN
jgi:hypothetical protein